MIPDGERLGNNTARTCSLCQHTGTDVESVTMHGDKYLPEYTRTQCSDWKACMTRRRVAEARAQRMYCHCCGDDFPEGTVRVIVLDGQPRHFNHYQCGRSCSVRNWHATPLRDRLAQDRVES